MPTPVPSAAYVWPVRNWTLSALTEAQYASWDTNGYLVVPNAVPRDLVADAAAAVRAFIGADDADPETWYKNTLDIYEDRTPEGARPPHGPSGMVQLYHHRALWAIRQQPKLHSIFRDLYGTRRLYVTADRAHFKPPQHPAHPAWSNPGDIHVGLHWDTDTLPSAWPVPFAVQGAIYLEDTTAAQGALRVVPGFHRRFESWSAAQPADRNRERPEGAAHDALAAEAVPLEGEAGSLVLWHSLLPHGPTANVGAAPRVSAYVTMLPVDAGPFLGPGRPADAPLGLNDAGTVTLLEMDLPSSGSEPLAASGEEACVAERGSRTKRQSRERRVERWRYRLPLLDEDPTEADLPRRPEGEEDGRPATLTALGERLVGLVEWEPEAEEG